MTPEQRALATEATNQAASAIGAIQVREEFEEGVALLLTAGARAMELAGFDPDETERGQLYRAIVAYIGEDHHPRLLGGASEQEEHR